MDAISDPVLQKIVFSKGFASRGVCHDSGADLFENAVCHGMAEESAGVHFVDISSLGELCESCS